eukprot:scaffold92243_cov22-Tisochrysis_lutea.AAC.1
MPGVGRGEARPDGAYAAIIFFQKSSEDFRTAREQCPTEDRRPYGNEVAPSRQSRGARRLQLHAPLGFIHTTHNKLYQRRSTKFIFDRHGPWSAPARLF